MCQFVISLYIIIPLFCVLVQMMTTTTWWTLMGIQTLPRAPLGTDSSLIGSSSGDSPAAFCRALRISVFCRKDHLQSYRTESRGTETQSHNIKPTLAFSSDHKLVWSTYLPTNLISTVQWCPLALVAETGRGSAPQQQLHQYLMSTTRCLMKSRVPLEVSYIHQCITLHTYTHTYFGVYLLLLISYFDMNPNSILTKAEPSNKFWGPDQMPSLWWLNVYLVLISCVCASVLVHAA